MKKIISLIFVLSGFGISWLHWLDCTRIADKFHFSSLDLQLRLIESIHNDVGSQLLIVRLFHNKLLGSIIDIYRSYVLFWDPRFLISIFGFVGLCLFVSGVYYSVKNKKEYRWLRGVLVVLLLLPLVEIVFYPHIAFIAKTLIFIIPFIIFQFFGALKLIQKSVWFAVVFVLLVVVSLWWNSVYTPILLEFCVK